jgi:hypothetical protein
MKKYELMTVLGKTMERLNMDSELIKGLGLEFHMTMKDSMYENIYKDEKETMALLNGLMGDDPRYVYYWVGVAIKTLAMSPSK